MDRIDEAFETVDRRAFLPAEFRGDSHIDAPIPIGYGQTNSQPTTVRMMLEWLDAQPGDKILDVGSGSGWTTALLAELVAPRGRVYAVEKIPELVEMGRTNCEIAGTRNVEFHEAGEQFGLHEFAPYDRILVSAAADHLPEELLSQLSLHGRLVVPVNSSILVIDRSAEEAYETEEHPGFMFVPLVA